MTLATGRFGAFSPEYKEGLPGPTEFVAFAVEGSSAPAVYVWNTTAGFGAQYAAPGTITNMGDGRQIAVSPNGRIIVVGGTTAPFITAYQFDIDTGFISNMGSPSSPPTGACFALRFNRAGTAIAYGQTSTGFGSKQVIVYNWNDNTGFGTRLSDMTLPSPATVSSIDFGPNDQAIILTATFAEGTGPFLRAYNWSNSTGFGTQIANPLIMPTGVTTAVRFNKAGNCVAFGTINSPFVFVYPWNSNSFGPKFNNPDVFPPGVVQSVDFVNGDNALIVGTTTSPYIRLYKWNNTLGFQGTYADPASPPARPVNTVEFSPNGKQAAYAATPGGGDSSGYQVSQTGITTNPGLFNKFSSLPAASDLVFGKKV